MMRSVVFAVIAVVGMGCASSAPADRTSDAKPPPAPERVVIVEEKDGVSDCSFLTEVQVDPPYTMLSKAYPELNFSTRYEMRTQLRRKTVRVGGDTVVPVELEDGRLQGKTYDCSGET